MVDSRVRFVVCSRPWGSDDSGHAASSRKPRLTLVGFWLRVFSFALALVMVIVLSILIHAGDPDSGDNPGERLGYIFGTALIPWGMGLAYFLLATRRRPGRISDGAITIAIMIGMCLVGLFGDLSSRGGAETDLRRTTDRLEADSESKLREVLRTDYPQIYDLIARGQHTPPGQQRERLVLEGRAMMISALQAAARKAPDGVMADRARVSLEELKVARRTSSRTCVSLSRGSHPDVRAAMGGRPTAMDTEMLREAARSPVSDATLLSAELLQTLKASAAASLTPAELDALEALHGRRPETDAEMHAACDFAIALREAALRGGPAQAAAFARSELLQ